MTSTQHTISPAADQTALRRSTDVRLARKAGLLYLVMAVLAGFAQAARAVQHAS